MSDRHSLWKDFEPFVGMVLLFLLLLAFDIYDVVMWIRRKIPV